MRNSITKKGGKGKGNPSDGIEEVVNSIWNIIVLQEKLTDNVDNFNKEVKSISEKMMRLSNCSSPGWHEYAISILDNIQVLNTPGLTPQYHLGQTWKVLEKLETLKGSSVLYERLKKGTALSNGGLFFGSCCYTWRSLVLCSAQHQKQKTRKTQRKVHAQLLGKGKLLRVCYTSAKGELQLNRVRPTNKRVHGAQERST